VPRAPRPPRTILVDAIDTEGNGLGFDDRGLRWTVRAAPPGARVKVVGRPKRGFRVAIEAPAPDALPAPCPAFGLCGGCVWQEVPLPRQRGEKELALDRLLGGLGGTVHPTLGEPEGYGWRNKAEFSFGVDRFLGDHERDAPRAGRWLGYHPVGHFDRIVDLAGCALVDPRLDAVYRAARADLLASPFAPWNPVTHEGFLRHLALRTGEEGVLAAIHTAPGDEHAADWLTRHAPRWGAVGVCWFEGAQKADAALGTLRAVLHGVPTVTARLGHLRFRLSPGTFFQVNVAAATRLADQVAAWVGRGARLWDLYCGGGALGLYCARQFDEVVGIERNAASIADAEANARENGIPARFHAGDVEALVHALPRPDAVIVDPPRAGLHPDALKVVAGLDADTLVYVACRASSLARDGLALHAAGWRLTDRVAVDLFPQTAHVEVASRWVRARA